VVLIKKKKEQGQSSPSYLLETPGVEGPPTSSTRVDEHRKKKNLRRWANTAVISDIALPFVSTSLLTLYSTTVTICTTRCNIQKLSDINTLCGQNAVLAYVRDDGSYHCILKT
jgi:hypothetical protein